MHRKFGLNLVKRYTISVLVILFVTGLNILISNIITPLPPFVLYFGGVLIISFYEGLGPGIVSIVLSAFLGWISFSPQLFTFSFKLHELISVVFFVGESLFIAKLATDVKKVNEKLAFNEERFRSILEKSNEGITLRSVKGHLLYMSTGVKRVVGYSESEYKHINLFSLIHPDDKKQYKRIYSNLLKKPFSTTTIPFRFKSKHNEWLWIEDTLTNLFEDRSVGAMVSNFRNISERMEIEERRNNFINMASHELKTPMTSMNIFVQILGKRLTQLDDLQGIKYVEKITIQLNNLSKLIQELLDVTRMQRGKLSIIKQTVFIKELIEEVISDLQPTTENALVIDWKTNSSVFADRERIRQVFTNLITNAIKYSPKKAKIIIRLRKKYGQVIVGVQDFGVGIPKKEQKKIFERFYQVKAHSTYPGLGLGLFISMQIVRQHKGKMWVESAEGKGSTFYFTLPIKK